MSDLLKQAIADAKAVRATALANAKAALEESFAPRMQAMLGEKLRQEIEGEEEAAAPEAPVADAPVPTEEPAPVADEVPVEEPALDAAPVAPEADIAPEAPVADEAPVGDEAPAAPVAGEEGEEEEELDLDEILGQGNPDPVQQTQELTEEKASTDYKKTTKGHKTEDPQGASKEFAKGPGKADKNETSGNLASKGGSTKASTDYKKTTSGHKTPDPQGASNEFSKGPSKTETNATGKTLEEGDMEIEDESLEEILKELETAVSEDCGAEAHGAEMGAGEDPAAQVKETDEIVNLDDLLESDDKDADDKKDEEESEKAELVQENISLKAELEKYRKGVTYLRNQINEVNLLNAKLLYTNKLFKKGNFTAEQKIKIIETLDLTTSTREAKLVYATLAESMSFSAKAPVVEAKAPVAKKPVTTTVKSITEGYASKPVASTKPTKAVITEGADMANRFQKLAGIKKV